MEINLTYFGGLADGKFDNTDAFEQAIKSCKVTGYTLNLPNGVLRVTRPVVVGVRCFEDKDIFNMRLVDMVKLKGEYALMKSFLPFKIKGGSRTIIYGDFEVTEPTAVFHIACKGDKRNAQSSEQEVMEISNVAFCTRGYIDATTGFPKTALTTAGNNNIIGIVGAFTHGITVKNITNLGLSHGIVLNNCYFANTFNNVFRYCGQGFEYIDCETSLHQSIRTVGCKRGVKVSSSNSTINNYTSEHCGAGLYINDSYTTVNGCYLETVVPVEAQLTIGENPGDPTYNAINAVKGTAMSGLIIALTGKQSQTKPLGMDLRDTTRTVQFFSGQALSIGLVTAPNPLTKAVLYDFNCTNIPAANVKKMLL